MWNRNIIIVIILLLFFALWAETSRADTFATRANKAGGQIVLTDVKCTKRSGLIAYAMIPDRSTEFGCWWYDDQYVHITWSDGDTRSYPKSGWTYPNVRSDT